MDRFDLAEAARDPEVVEHVLDRAGPEVVFLAGGTASAETCERDEAVARAEHAHGPAAVAAACARLGVLLVYFSSDLVFDGLGGPYAEDAKPAPLTALGRAKAAGEAAVVLASPRNLVVRTSWVYGPEARGEGPAYRIARALGEGRAVPVASDLYSTPTYSRDLAGAVVALAGTGVSGVVHVAGPETMNPASFALLVAECAGGRPGLLRPQTAASLRLESLRPRWSGLRCDRFHSLFRSLPLRAPREGLAHWMKNQRGYLWPL
jgi:dTDP-4-dehydrorhamnose reductase